MFDLETQHEISTQVVVLLRETVLWCVVRCAAVSRVTAQRVASERGGRVKDIRSLLVLGHAADSPPRQRGRHQAQQLCYSACC